MYEDLTKKDKDRVSDREKEGERERERETERDRETMCVCVKNKTLQCNLTDVMRLDVREEVGHKIIPLSQNKDVFVILVFFHQYK